MNVGYETADLEQEPGFSESPFSDLNIGIMTQTHKVIIELKEIQPDSGRQPKSNNS